MTKAERGATAMSTTGTIMRMLWRTMAAMATMVVNMNMVVVAITGRDRPANGRSALKKRRPLRQSA